MTMAMPVCLASRVSCAAHSRTCDTEPGAAVSSPLYSVWIESITATVGFCSDTAAWIASSRISANRLTLPVARPSRRARSATCSADSSPVTYSTEVVSDRDASACSSSVDLPMPGSPPISTTAPATRPPPSTRSNSSRPVGWRGVSRASISDRLRTGLLLASGAYRWAAADGADDSTVSSSVFQALQCGHLPCHFAVVPPHSAQT